MMSKMTTVENSAFVNIGRQVAHAFCWLVSMAMVALCLAALFHVNELGWQAGLIFGALWNSFTAVEMWWKMTGGLR